MLAGVTVCGLLLSLAIAAHADRPAAHRKQAKPAPPEAASAGPKVTKIGDIVIKNYRSLTGPLDLSVVHVSGPNTTIFIL